MLPNDQGDATDSRGYLVESCVGLAQSPTPALGCRKLGLDP
jgi:hypothetical protein